MYNVSESKSTNGNKYNPKVGVGLFPSNEPWEDKPDKYYKEGLLYITPYITDSNQAFVGELVDKHLDSAMLKTPLNHFCEAVDPTTLNVVLANIDGKQTGVDVLQNYIGKTFPIIDIGNDPKYKYIIEIKGERIAVSAKNVIFVPKYFDYKCKLQKKTLVEFRGVKFFVQNTLVREFPVFKVITTQGKKFYLAPYGLKEKKTVAFFSLFKSDFFSKNGFDFLDSDYTMVNNIYFTQDFVENSHAIYMPGSRSEIFRYVVEEEMFEEMRKTLAPRFIFHKATQTFITNPKYYDILQINVKEIRERFQPRVRGRRHQNRDGGIYHEIRFPNEPIDDGL